MKETMQSTQQQQRHEKLIGFHKKMVDTYSAVQRPSKETITKAFSDIIVPDCTKLVPFTGYYSMSGAAGAFLSIDTTMHYSISPIFPLNFASATITVSMDGKSSATYSFDFTTTFDGQTLIIPNVLTLQFTRGYRDGTLVTFTGTINGTQVTGSTLFNPVPLSSFVGNYLGVSPLTGQTVLSIADELDVKFDFNTNELMQVGSYTYNPGMYVLTFSDLQLSQNYVLMLGTASEMGLACSIQHPGLDNRFAVTIIPS